MLKECCKDLIDSELRTYSFTPKGDYYRRVELKFNFCLQCGSSLKLPDKGKIEKWCTCDAPEFRYWKIPHDKEFNECYHCYLPIKPKKKIEKLGILDPSSADYEDVIDNRIKINEIIERLND
ncbi:hypothetical protein LCGC14_1765530 [marine sediment metagenome]|uniref:Uncharacterized protein n=1 Tax=marine sediment metagenome TaxID=412755 RepID=A0A0F9JZJ2_9ZZZZ